jgi:deoxyribodipyrimidine photolyase
MNLFIFRRDLRIQDNTTLIKMFQELKEKIIVAFIFTPEQINQKKNNYFSHNSVQFMIESLHDLADEIKEYGGE